MERGLQLLSGPSLITDYVPGTPTAFGAAYKAHLASLSP